MIQVIATPRGLEVVDRDDMTPGTGQVLIDVEAAGVGLVDVLMSQAMGPQDQGFVPGIEVAGLVAAVGQGVDPSLVGTRTYAMLPSGGYAEAVVVSLDAIIPIPNEITASAAVAIGVNALVAHFVLKRASVVAGERVLVRGASGGIGVMAVQLAAAMGAEVVASTRGGDREQLRALGAAEIVDAAATGAGDVDVVIDLVAGAAVEGFLARLKPNGRMVIAGIAGGMPPVDFGRALIAGFRKSLGVSTFSLDTVEPVMVRASTEELFAMAAEKRLSGVIQQEFPLNDAGRAHAVLADGGAFGKLVLRSG